MSGGGKGGRTTQGQTGTTTQTVKIPAWLEDAAQRNMARADKIAQLDFMPYFGPDVAGFSPMQMAAMQATNDAAAAFGVGGGNAAAGVPQPMTFAGGVQGYSSQPLFQQSLDALAAARPGQFAARNAMFINPVTGAEPAAPFGSTSSRRRDSDKKSSSSSARPQASQWHQPNPMVTNGLGYSTYASPSSDRSAAEMAALAPHRNPGDGTGSFGLPNPMSGGISSIGGSSRPSGMGGGK